MGSDDKKPVISQEDIMKTLDSCYEKCLNGIQKLSPNVEDMANDYLQKYETKENQDETFKYIQIFYFISVSVPGAMRPLYADTDFI